MRSIPPRSIEKEYTADEDKSSKNSKESLSFLEKLKYFKKVLQYGTICFVSLALFIAYIGFKDDIQYWASQNAPKQSKVQEAQIDYNFVDSELYKKRNVENANRNFFQRHFCRGAAQAKFCQ